MVSILKIARNSVIALGGLGFLYYGCSQEYSRVYEEVKKVEREEGKERAIEYAKTQLRRIEGRDIFIGLILC